MDKTKEAKVKRKDIITIENFKEFINPRHNGFAIITGVTHFMIDFDEKKHNPPQEIKEELMEGCEAVEETPGGYHFWFKIDDRTLSLKSDTNIKWKNIQIIGLDIRANKGVGYISPSYYFIEKERKEYKWIKGNLSTANTINDVLLDCLLYKESNIIINPNFKIESSIDDNGRKIVKITSKNNECWVEEGYIHSQNEHTCIFVTKTKNGYNATAHCYSHGKRKLTKEECKTKLIDLGLLDENDDGFEDEYEITKKTFEETNFKVLDPIGFYTKIGERWVFRERNQMKFAYENMFLSDGACFIDKWLKDPKMKTYSGVAFEETTEPNIFIIPPPPPPSFVYKTYKCKPSEEAVGKFDELIDILTSRKYEIKEYILNWLANLLQKPQELPGVAIILNGQKGAGKDTLGDFIGEYVIGSRYYQNYQNQAQYFNKHDELKVNKYLVKLEELDKKMLEIGVNGEVFKSAVTSTKLNIDPKNGRAFNTPNVQHILISSNKSLPVNVDQKERRWVISVVSPEKIGQHDFWKELRSILFCQEGGLAIAEMLLKRDISKFNPRMLPKNEYLEELQEETKDSIVKFIEHTKEDASGNMVYSLESGEYAASLLYTRYKEFCVENEISHYTNTKFGRQIIFLVANGSIERAVVKTYTNKGTSYIIG